MYDHENICLDMSKKLFSKVKSERKFAKAGEGYRLNEPSSPSISQPVQSQTCPRSALRQNSDSVAAAEAAHQRLQHLDSAENAC